MVFGSDPIDGEMKPEPRMWILRNDDLVARQEIRRFIEDSARGGPKASSLRRRGLRRDGI